MAAQFQEAPLVRQHLHPFSGWEVKMMIALGTGMQGSVNILIKNDLTAAWAAGDQIIRDVRLLFGYPDSHVLRLFKPIHDKLLTRY